MNKNNILSELTQYLIKRKHPVNLYREILEKLQVQTKIANPWAIDLEPIQSMPDVLSCSLMHGGYNDEQVYLEITVKDPIQGKRHETFLICEDEKEGFLAENVLQLSHLEELEEENRLIEELLQDKEKLEDYAKTIYDYRKAKKRINEMKSYHVLRDFLHWHFEGKKWSKNQNVT